jgi:GH18 family chitinase
MTRPFTKKYSAALITLFLIQAIGYGAPFRVVGYLPYGPDLVARAAAIDLTRLTVLNIAFLNPDPAGEIPPDDGLGQVTELAHTKGVKVLISIGGGDPPAVLKELLKRKAGQEFLVATLTAVCDRYNIDGIDVDLEGPLVDTHYESFVARLAAALRTRNKLLTAAIATVYASDYTDKTLSFYDFVNLMSYDKTGPWDKSRPGPHAPYSMAVDDLNYWTTTRRLPAQKINLGLPFYGYGFGPGAPESISFHDLAEKYPSDLDHDQITLEPNSIIYYNGTTTISAKVSLALQKAGGIMIWQLLQDADPPHSLLHKIDSLIKIK